ncbi:hypothetical protein [Paenibacillus polymyxa]|uniref:hypothetical protein n=1 Tax=Paenibacillus polymyxa TaxID=1406 RepID=UPI00287F42E5|nr:hypothetical protein [Paenibacillus polymyxa]
MKKTWFTILATLTMVAALGASVSTASVPAAEQITKDQATPSVEVLPAGTGSNEKAADKIGIVDNMNKPVIEITSDAKVEILDPATDKTSALDPKKISTSSSLGLLSTTYPTSFWNINSQGTYIAEFSGVRDTIYTNYYFPTNSSGEIKIRGTVNEDYPHSGSYTITAYELGSNKAVSSSTFKTGERIFVRIYNLNKNKNYFFGVTYNSANTISGVLSIDHS